MNGDKSGGGDKGSIEEFNAKDEEEETGSVNGVVVEVVEVVEIDNDDETEDDFF